MAPAKIEPSSSYLRRMKTLFYLYDTNKDSILSKDELFEAQSQAYEKADVYYRNVHTCENEAWQELFPNDTTDFKRYLETHTRSLNDDLWRRNLEALYEPIFERQFQTIDLNKDGYVSLSEYKKHVFSYWAEPKNSEEVAETQFKVIDTNKDGLISVEEYVAWQQRYFLSDNKEDSIELWGWLISDAEWNKYYKGIWTP